MISIDVQNCGYIADMFRGLVFDGTKFQYPKHAIVGLTRALADASYYCEPDLWISLKEARALTEYSSGWLAYLARHCFLLSLKKKGCWFFFQPSVEYYLQSTGRNVKIEDVNFKFTREL